MNIEIIKCHGSENDFIMIDEISQNYGLTELQREIIAQSLCNRDSILGADGILFLVKTPKADGMMRMFNPDGSEAKMCGNGIRCVARKLFEITQKPKMSIDTIGGMQYVEYIPDFFTGIEAFSVEMRNVSLSPDAIPLQSEEKTHLELPIKQLSSTRTFSAISLGNPHLLSLVEKVDLAELKTVGENVNEATGKEILPEGANISFCQPLGGQNVYVGTFERGAGLTNSCGTGMSASTLAACLAGKVEFNDWVNVYNAGGMVKCKGVNHDGTLSVYLLGNATYSFSARVEIDFENSVGYSVSNKIDFSTEEQAYKKLKEEAMATLNS